MLLIITDGIITDLDQTKLAIINACELPFSLIIVGVGNEDFSSMEVIIFVKTVHKLIISQFLVTILILNLKLERIQCM